MKVDSDGRAEGHVVRHSVHCHGLAGRTRKTPHARAMRQVASAVGAAAFAAMAGATWAAEPTPAIPEPYRSVATGLPVVPFGVGTGARRGDLGLALVPPLQWEVRTQDLTLAGTLERWASQAGYRVQWDAKRNVPIGAAESY